MALLLRRRIDHPQETHDIEMAFQTVRLLPNSNPRIAKSQSVTDGRRRGERDHPGHHGDL